MSQFTFDATQVKPQGDRSPLPKGDYPVIATASELKSAKAPSTGTFIALTMKVTDGPAKDQLIFTNLNVIHSNPVAQQIGQERLSALCHSVGVLQITDTAQLHGRPFIVKASVTADGKYNEIDAFLRADGSSAGGGAAPSAGAAAPPWATPAPTSPAAAQAAPVAPVPAPTPPPATPPQPAPQFYVANLQGQNLTPSPVTADQVRAMPTGLANLQICPVGGSAWQPASVLATSTVPPVTGAPVPSTTTVPPWLQSPPPQ